MSATHQKPRRAKNVDYRLNIANNTEVGTATITLVGEGDYTGVVTKYFSITDNNIFSFLYDNGTLVLKVGHGLPGTGLISSTYDLVDSRVWLADGAAAQDGAEVWQDHLKDVKNVVIDSSLGRIAPTSLDHWFANFSKLTKVTGLENINTAQVTSAAGMFQGCASLKTVDVSVLSLPVNQSLADFFKDCTSLTSVGRLNNLDSPALRSMAGMFQGCTALTTLEIPSLTTSGVTDVSRLVNGCTNLVTLSLSGLDLSHVTASTDAFSDCPNLTTISTTWSFKNAADASARLKLPSTCYRISPAYVRMAAGKPMPNGAYAYRLRDLAMQFCTVQIPKPTYTCTGKAIKPTITVKLGSIKLVEGRDYTITYANNVYPGKATAAIEGKGIMSGGLEVPYTIVARTTKVGDRLTYTKNDTVYTLEVTAVEDEGKLAEVALVKVNVRDDKLRSLALPTKCTIGGSTITITSISSKLRGNFRNVNNVIVGSTVTRIGASAFCTAYKVKYLTIKSARLTNATNCLKGSRITAVATRVPLTYAKQKTYWTMFRKKAGKNVAYKYYGY